MFQADTGEGLARGVVFVAPWVVVVFIVVALSVFFQVTRDMLVKLRIGGVLERVVLEHDRAGRHPGELLELAHMTSRRRAAGSTVVDTAAQVNQRLRGIGKDQAMATASVCGKKLMEVEQPLFGGKALDEGEIALTVLYAVLPRFGFTGEGKGDIPQSALVTQGSENGQRRDLLKDAGIMAQAEPPQRRAGHQRIEGAPMATVPSAKFTDDGVDPAQHLAVLPNGQGHGAIEQVIGGEAAVTTGEAQLEGKRLGERFFQREIDHRQVD